MPAPWRRSVGLKRPGGATRIIPPASPGLLWQSAAGHFGAPTSVPP